MLVFSYQVFISRYTAPLFPILTSDQRPTDRCCWIVGGMASRRSPHDGLYSPDCKDITQGGRWAEFVGSWIESMWLRVGKNRRTSTGRRICRLVVAARCFAEHGQDEPTENRVQAGVSGHGQGMDFLLQNCAPLFSYNSHPVQFFFLHHHPWWWWSLVDMPWQPGCLPCLAWPPLSSFCTKVN